MTRTSRNRPLAPTSALDRALEALAAGDADLALRWAVPALADEDTGAAAADLVGRALTLAERPELAIDAHGLAVESLLRQGLAPHAVAAALALRDLTASDEALTRVAQAFGTAGATRQTLRPPALKSPEIVPLGAKLTREELVAAAEAALTARPRPTEAPAPQPRLPLWGSLPTEAFERLARALSVRICSPGEALTTEGEPGESAFILARGEVRVTRAATPGEGEREGEGEGSPGDEALELAVLGPGAIVGEMALVTAAPRAATVIATRGALVLEAPRAALDEAAAEVPALGQQVVSFCRRRLVDNVLRTSPLLREVPMAEREGLVPLFETRTFEPGEGLITQGETGAGLHLIAAGRVEVTHTEEGGDALRIAELGPGSCVGEIALVLRRAATASVIATEPTVSLVLAADRFLEVVRDRPKLLASLYELAVRREDETLSVVGQEAVDIGDAVIV